MKRSGRLLPQIVHPDNLRLAFWKARKGKTHRTEVVHYRANLDENLAQLRAQLISGKPLVGDYSYFSVYEPKERQICAAPFSQRVLHHALMNVCHGSFEAFQIEHSYASRKGKGTYAAIAQAHQNQKHFRYYLKLDVRRYFDSIPHSELKHALQRRFKESKLLDIFDSIIDSYCVQRGHGVPIGNLTSQYFANHFLGLADHYLKETIRCRPYVRYMDDMVLWSNDVNELKKWNALFSQFIEDLGLFLKPACMNSADKGLPFCGYRIFPHTIRLKQASKKRYSDKLKRYTFLLKKEMWSQSDFQRHVLPLLAFTRHADSAGFRQKLNCQLNLIG